MLTQSLEPYILPEKRDLVNQVWLHLTAQYPETLYENIRCCSKHGDSNTQTALLSCTNFPLQDRVKLMEDWVSKNLPVLQTSELFEKRRAGSIPLSL